jgi:menaquinone-9 beta-reductase
MASSTSAWTDASPPPAEPLCDVLVVGAGPGGSAVATLLARAGYRVAAVDRAAFPRDKACSEYMSPEAVRLLDRLGVVGAVEAAGAAPLHGTTVTAARGSRLQGRFSHAGAAPFRPTGLSVARRILDQVLVESARAAGVRVLERTAVDDLLYDRGAVAGAVVRDADGVRRSIRARLTIGADGLRSIVARRLGPRRHGRPRRIAFVAHMDGVAGLGTSAEMHVGRAGYVGLNAIGGGRANVALVVPAARGVEARGRVEGFFLEALRAFPGLHERVAAGSLARRVLATGPFAAWSGRVTADGAALVGDAADFFDPFTGEGIYSALRGAELLAGVAGDALAEPGPVSAARLAPYRRARRRAFAGKWVVERLIGYGMEFPALFDHAVGRLGRRAGMADTLVGVTADFVPARRVLNPLFLARMLL